MFLLFDDSDGSSLNSADHPAASSVSLSGTGGSNKPRFPSEVRRRWDGGEGSALCFLLFGSFEHRCFPPVRIIQTELELQQLLCESSSQSVSKINYFLVILLNICFSLSARVHSLCRRASFLYCGFNHEVENKRINLMLPLIVQHVPRVVLITVQQNKRHPNTVIRTHVRRLLVDVRNDSSHRQRDTRVRVHHSDQHVGHSLTSNSRHTVRGQV